MSEKLSTAELAEFKDRFGRDCIVVSETTKIKSLDYSISFKADMTKAREEWEKFNAEIGRRKAAIDYGSTTDAINTATAEWSKRNEALRASREWDCQAADDNSHNIKDVLLDGKSIKCVSAAVKVGTGEALCFAHRINAEGKIEMIDPTNVLHGESAEMYIATGKLAVLFDGYAIGNYGPVTAH